MTLAPNPPQQSEAGEPTSAEPQAVSNQYQESNLATASTKLLADAALFLFGIYSVVVGFDLFPLRIADPLWLINSATSLVNAISILFAGIVFLHLAAILAPYTNWIQQRHRFVSRIVAWASLGFLLLIPLLGFATWRGITNVNSANRQQRASYAKTANRLLNAVDRASTPRELQQSMRALKGPQIGDQDLGLPLEKLKSAGKQIINQALAISIANLPRPESEDYKPLYLQTLRTSVLALLSSVGLAAVSWDSLKQESLLQSFFNKRRGPGLQAAKLLAPLRSLLAFLAQPFRRNRSSEDRRRFWSEVKNRDKRASALRAKEIKRNAAKIRKLQLDRERQRRQLDRERQRQERRDRKRQQDEES